jgi:hypothetical protein
VDEEDEMIYKPLVECAHGWGRSFRLYADRLEVDGVSYLLYNLVYIRPIYCHTLGISSLRIELCFKEKYIVLRGIAALDAGRKAIAYLNTHALIPHALPEEAPTSTDYRNTPVPHSPVLDDEAQLEPTQKRPRIPPVAREDARELEALARRLQQEPLPRLTVPLRLLSGEYAHYVVAATRCAEAPEGASAHTRRVVDQGMLMLTSKRIIYLGRKGQFALAYPRLLHVSRSGPAIAFLAQHNPKRETFEVQRPLECTLYLERILQLLLPKEQLRHACEIELRPEEIAHVSQL